MLTETRGLAAALTLMVAYLAEQMAAALVVATVTAAVMVWRRRHTITYRLAYKGVIYVPGIYHPGVAAGRHTVRQVTR